MDNVNVDIPTPDLQREAEISSLRNVVARNLKVETQDVNLHNADEFLRGSRRFLYGFTQPPEQTAGFFKMAQIPENSQQLQREDLGMRIAQRLGIPTVNVLRGFQNTPEGYGLIHMERIYTENGVILTNSIIAEADPQYGTRAARALANAGGRVIPKDIDSLLLKRGDKRNQSAETFWGVWETQNGIAFAEGNATLVDSLIGRERLHALVDQTRAAIAPLIEAGTNPDVEYFVHNDTAPNNMFFSDTTDQVILLDFEHAAATHNLTLAQLTDLGNFYGRMWPNPEMQQQFLTAYLAASPPASLEYNYQLLRAVAVFGAMYLSKYAMQPNHGEHPMALSLIGNLEANLAVLDQRYNAMRTPTA